MAVADPDRRVISYVLSNQEPVHRSGTIIRSRLTDWELNKADLYVPEQISLSRRCHPDRRVQRHVPGG